LSLSSPSPIDHTESLNPRNASIVSQGPAIVDGENQMKSDDIPDRLPIWNWRNDSCGLDATLTIALLFIRHALETRPSWVDTHKRSNRCFDTLANCVVSWSKGNAQWERWEETALTAARDAIRAILEGVGTQIGLNSSADDIIMKLIPSALTETEVSFQITCGRCLEDFSSPRTYPLLMFDGLLQASSDSQALIDHMVCIHVLHELTGRYRRGCSTDIRIHGPV
jgi:hypothetical protein